MKPVRSPIERGGVESRPRVCPFTWRCLRQVPAAAARATQSAESSGRKSAPMNAFGKHQETSLLKTPHPQQSLVRAGLRWSCVGQGVQGRWARSRPVLACGGRLVWSQALQILKFTTLKNNHQIPTCSVFMGKTHTWSLILSSPSQYPPAHAFPDLKDDYGPAPEPAFTVV